MTKVRGEAEVLIDGKQPAQVLEGLEKKAADFKRQLVELRKQPVLDNKKIKDTQAKLIAVNKEIKSVKAQTVSYNKVLKNLSGASLKELESAYRKLRAETKGLNRDTTKYKKNAGNLQRIQTEIRKVKKEMSGAGVATKGFSFNLKEIASQAVGFAGITALATEGFRRFKETSEELIDIQQNLTSSFDLSKRELKLFSAELRAISDTFKVDYKQTTESATIAAKKFNVPLENIIANIEEGFEKGSNKTGEFNDIIKQTSARMADAGISADQYFSIINQSVTSGAYSDKGIQAIAEGAQRLREYTKATQDALAPLDESVKLQIQQEIAAGNSFKAVQLVSGALKDTSLTASEAQTIIADVFAGDGEEAGRAYLEMISEMDESLANMAVTATENEQANLNLSKSWNRFVAGVSESDGIFSKVWAKFKDLLSGAINGMTILINQINGGDKAFDKISIAVERLKQKQEEAAEAAKIEAEEQKKLTEEQKKAYKERQKANKQLEDQIKSLNIKLIEDERQRTIEETNLWAEKEKEKVKASKGSAQLKAQAVEAIEKNHKMKLEEIDEDYNQKVLQRFQGVEKFLKDQNAKLETDRQAIINRELEAIAEKYDKQIELAEGNEELINELKITKDAELKAYQEEAELEHAENIKAIREEYGLVTDEEKMQEELDELKAFYDAKLLTDEEYEIALAAIRAKYKQDEESEWTKHWNEKFKTTRKYIQKEQAITQALGDFISSAKQAELAEAGDNEEKKKEIMKKYADKEFIVKASQILASTAEAAMKAYAQLGPIAGPIAAAIITATGFIKLGIANSERQRVKGLEDGDYFGVTREQDGKYFNALFGGGKRGYFDRPTVLVGENNKREFVVSYKSLQIPAIQRAVSAIDSYQKGQGLKYFSYNKVNRAIGAVKGYQEGGTFGGSSNASANIPESEVPGLLMMLINKVDEYSTKVDSWANEIEVFVLLQKIRDADDKLSALEAEVKLG